MLDRVDAAADRAAESASRRVRLPRSSSIARRCTPAAMPVIRARPSCAGRVEFRVMLRFLTAGESHGQALVTIVEGLPAGQRQRGGDERNGDEQSVYNP